MENVRKVEYQKCLKHPEQFKPTSSLKRKNVLLLCCVKVRSLWSTVDGMLRSTSDDQNAVESVLKGDANQYVLDGTDRVLTIPQSLLERVERLPHQVRLETKSSLAQAEVLLKC